MRPAASTARTALPEEQPIHVPKRHDREWRWPRQPRRRACLAGAPAGRVGGSQGVAREPGPAERVSEGFRSLTGRQGAPLVHESGEWVRRIAPGQPHARCRSPAGAGKPTVTTVERRIRVGSQNQAAPQRRVRLRRHPTRSGPSSSLPLRAPSLPRSPRTTAPIHTRCAHGSAARGSQRWLRRPRRGE